MCLVIQVAVNAVVCCDNLFTTCDISLQHRHSTGVGVTMQCMHKHLYLHLYFVGIATYLTNNEVSCNQFSGFVISLFPSLSDVALLPLGSN